MNNKIRAVICVSIVACIVLSRHYTLLLGGVKVYLIVSLAVAIAVNLHTHAGLQHKTASKVINKVGGGHRGITHSLIFPAIIIGLMYYVSTLDANYKYITSVLMSLFFGCLIGWLIHLFVDLLPKPKPEPVVDRVVKVCNTTEHAHANISQELFDGLTTKQS